MLISFLPLKSYIKASLMNKMGPIIVTKYIILNMTDTSYNQCDILFILLIFTFGVSSCHCDRPLQPVVEFQSR